VFRRKGLLDRRAALGLTGEGFPEEIPLVTGFPEVVRTGEREVVLLVNWLGRVVLPVKEVRCVLAVSNPLLSPRGRLRLLSKSGMVFWFFGYS